MPVATFTFYGQLNFFLPRRFKHKAIKHQFDWRGSVKDMIEAIAPPHPEVELIVVNGQSVGWDAIVEDGDIVDVYPDYGAISMPDKVRLIPPYRGTPRFILDTHLGRLAAYLRMMGFDTLYRNDYEDEVLAQVSADENRILLTRDVGVLKRSIVVYGYFVRNTNPRKRLHEICERYQLDKHLDPFGRCVACNGTLRPVSKDSIRHAIPGDTYRAFNEFQRCQSCEKIFWKGSHYERMQSMIDDVLGQ